VRVNLIDTGPIVAIINRRDHHHQWAEDTLSRLSPPFLTCEAVISEATYIVKNIPTGAVGVVEMAERQYLRPSFRLDAEAAAVKVLLARYRDVQMELADACLVRLAELHGDCLLVTVDSEFREVYRRHGRQMIPTLMPPDVRGRARRRPDPSKSS
jgi:uncharacterized protein